MNNAPEVAMTVIEPGGRRWAQLLNATWSLGDLLPLIIGRLDLPERVNYQLQHVRSGRVLKQGDSLSSAGIAPGEELQISPVRNKLLADLLDALYGEAVGYVAKELWGQAESRLETLFRLEPNHPDPKGLREAVATRVVPVGLATAAAASGYAGSSAPAGSTATSSAGRPQPPPGSQSPGAQPSYTGQPQPAYTPGPPPAAAPVAEAAKPRSACAVLAIIFGVLFLVGVAVVVGGYIWFSRQMAEPLGVLIPTLVANPNLGGVGEPVLGTGDVQVTLRWDNAADLDLHVIDPGQEEISYSAPFSASGGRLDVDANASCSGDPAVENVFWPTGGAPTGVYQVSVAYYGPCGVTGSTNYEVTITVDGQVVDVRSGTLTAEGETQFVGEFTR